MGHSVTLGGDRLGAGKKQKVHLRGFERSTHNLSRVIRTSMACGTLVPIMKELAKPGDTWDINIDVDMRTHPTIGPLFGSYKVQVDTFLAPIRLYNSWLHNNKLNIGRNMAQVKLPQLELTLEEYDEETITDWNNSQVNPSALLKYLGISGIGRRDPLSTGVVYRRFNAVPLLAYFDIYKNYYANKQEEIGAVIHTGTSAINETVTAITVDGNTFTSGTAINVNTGSEIKITYVGAAPSAQDIYITGNLYGESQIANLVNDWTDDGAGTITAYALDTQDWISWRYRTATDLNQTAPEIATFPLENIDTMREQILMTPGNTPFIVTEEAYAPYSWINGKVGDIYNRLSTQELLAIKTYQSDLFNNWLNTEWMDGPGGINEITAVDTSSGNFKIDAIILARKVYDMLNRIAVSGGTYFDWQNAVHDHEPFRQCSTPMYMGGLSKELVFQEVVSNSGQEGEPLGTLAGKGVLSGKHKGGHVTIKVDELSYIIVIISLTPRIDYSQGNDWDVTLDNMDQPHKPDLDQIGFQELTTEQMAWWDTRHNGAAPVPGVDDWVQQSAGKQPAWINYMTAVNKCYGNFAIEAGSKGKVGGGEMFMTLNRRYEKATGDAGIFDLTTYIDPVKYNNIFAEEKLDAQNFWAQIGLDVTARRKMSAKIMPNL